MPTLLSNRFLHINSKNRSYGSKSNFGINIPSDIFGYEFNVDNAYLKMNLQEICVNFSWYNVQTGINDIFQYYSSADDTTYELNIPQGSYNVFELRDILNDLLEEEYVVSYLSGTNTYLFQALSPLNTITSVTAGQFLGLENLILYNGSFSSVKPVNMTYINTLYLHSDVARASDAFDNIENPNISHSTIVARVPIMTAPFSNINYKNELNTNEGITLALRQFDSMRFFLCDERGNFINLSNDFNFTLRFEIYSS